MGDWGVENNGKRLNSMQKKKRRRERLYVTNAIRKGNNDQKVRVKKRIAEGMGDYTFMSRDGLACASGQDHQRLVFRFSATRSTIHCSSFHHR